MTDLPNGAYEGVPGQEIVVHVPGVVLTAAEAATGSGLPVATLNLVPPKWLLIGGGLAAGAVMQLTGFDMRWVLWGAIALVFAIIVGAIVTRWLNGRIGRARTEHRFGAQALDWRLDETEVRQTGPFLDMALPWTAFVHVLDEPRGFVFVMSPVNALFLPRRLLSEQQQAAIRELIDRARDRGLIGNTPADLLPPWDLVRESVRERYQPF